MLAEWKRAGVNIDYQVDLEQYYYNVPYQLMGKEVDVRYTQVVWWRSYIKASAWLRMRPVTVPANISRWPNIGPKLIKNTWSGHRRGLWIGPPPSDRSRRNWQG